MGLQRISELSTTNGGRMQLYQKRAPDYGGGDMKAPLTTFSVGLKNQHVMMFEQMAMCPTRDVSDQHADIFEVGQASAMDSKHSERQ